MRLLLLAPHFHPYQNPRAHRWSAIAREWAAMGWEVHVVCSRYPSHPREETWHGVSLHRTGFNSVREWIYSMRGNMPRRGQPGQGRLAPWALQLNNALLKSFYWPDEAWPWIGPARRKALQLLKTGHWDALISVSLPFSAHWAALSLKSRFPKPLWLADVGDPFSFQPDHPINNEFFYGKKNRKAELRILQTADHVVVTNENMRKIFPQNNVHVIPPIASFSLESISEKTFSQDFRLGYFGAFFKKIREPAPLLRFFESFHRSNPRCTFHFYGEIFENFWPVFARFPELKSSMVFHGAVGREAVAAAMQEMDALVLLGNTTSFQLPSKWADYLVSGKPILHLLQNTDDAALEFAAYAPQVCSISSDDEKGPEKALAFLSSPPAMADQIFWARRFSAGVVAGEYGSLLVEPSSDSPPQVIG
jgi:hypothetical protein